MTKATIRGSGTTVRFPRFESGRGSSNASVSRRRTITRHVYMKSRRLGPFEPICQTVQPDGYPRKNMAKPESERANRLRARCRAIEPNAPCDAASIYFGNVISCYDGQVH